MERTALHEAGHAVVAWSFDITGGALYLDRVNKSGHFDLAGYAHLEPFKQIAIALAGFEAEQTLKPPGSKRRAFDDFHDKVPVILRNNGTSLDESKGKALRKNGRACAKRRLLKHERKVRAVADHLVEHHYMDRVTFEALMKDPNL
jgi:hypothetical protein